VPVGVIPLDYFYVTTEKRDGASSLVLTARPRMLSHIKQEFVIRPCVPNETELKEWLEILRLKVDYFC
jgi:hypothetical protein